MKANRHGATVVRGLSMQSEMAEKIDARMNQFGITSFSQYIQLLVRRDLTEGGPLHIPISPLPAIKVDTGGTRGAPTPSL